MLVGIDGFPSQLSRINGRKFVVEPEWTRVGPSLKHKSILDCIITDTQLMEVSGHTQVDNTDIRCSDHHLVCMELSKSKTTRNMFLGNGI